VELLVVISVMGMLMAIGVGVWLAFRSSSKRRGAFQSLMAACRRARVFALEEAAGGRLVLECPARGPHGFRAEGLRLVGFWQLESSADPGSPGGMDPLLGFAGRRLEESGAVYHTADGPVDGHRGTGLYFPNGGTVSLPVEGLRLPGGGRFSCSLMPTVSGRKQVVVSRGRELSLVITPQMELEARAGSALVTTPGFRLPLGRWSKVSLSWSPEEVVVSVDDVPRGRTLPDERVDLPAEKELELPLEMGGGELPLFGYLDEIAVHRAVRERQTLLPAPLVLDCQVGEIRFDAAGGLDRSFHSGPVRIGLREAGDADGAEVRWLRITLMGEIGED
jgi:hypothetical protein